jgi:hypothetical protein
VVSLSILSLCCLRVVPDICHQIDPYLLYENVIRDIIPTPSVGSVYGPREAI